MLLVAMLFSASYLLVMSPEAQAIGEGVSIPSERRHVLEGTSVPIDIIFGTNDNEETVQVTCLSRCTATVWERTVRYGENRPNCNVVNGLRQCRISFPQGFVDASGTGPTPSELGEPARRDRYQVRISSTITPQVTTLFDVWLSSTHTCRNGEATRSDIVVLATAGHATGEQFTIEVVDRMPGGTEKVAMSQTRTSQSPTIAYHFLWEVPLDYDLGPNQAQPFEVRVSSPTKQESESFTLFPAVAEPIYFADPGRGDQPNPIRRTETAFLVVRFLFFSAPEGCQEASRERRVVPVTGEDLAQDTLDVRVLKIEQVQGSQSFAETVDQTTMNYVAPLVQFWTNYTVPRDLESTRPGTQNPQYRLSVAEQQLADGNLIPELNSTTFTVKPYTIIPRIESMPTEVERLESATIELNLTYADGSWLTPNETNEDLLIEFGPVGEPAIFQRPLDYRNKSIWNMSIEIPFDYEPLGEYQWFLRKAEDDADRPGFRNNITANGWASNIVRVVGARPLIDFHTIVGDDEVNGTERTRTVHVSLSAIFKNGVPLTRNNVDPGLGGVMLNIKKKNEFGRILDIDRLVMTDADDQGGWVRTFRIGRSADEAPVGTWEIEVIARDNKDPVNGNTTSFPFEVEPARIFVSPTRSPPDMVRGGILRYDVRMTYPDGSLFTAELADPDRGARLTSELHRVSIFNTTIVEDRQRPRTVAGGLEWSVQIDADTLVPGPHFLNISGRDIHGNIVGPHNSRLFTVLFNGEFRNSTTPICPNPEGLEEPPPCELARGTDIFAVFPGAEGDKGFFDEDPVIQVFRKLPEEDRWVIHRLDVRIEADEFFEMTGKEAGDNHVGHFTTDETTPVGTYLLFIIGRNKDDEGFAGFTHRFNITPIEVDRNVITKLPPVSEKGERLTALIEKQPGDVIDRVQVVSGPVTSQAVRVTPTALGTFLQWTPARSTPTGPSTIEVLGRDLFGNRFRVTLGPVELSPLEVRVQPEQPPRPEVQRDTFARLEARLVFPDGLAYTTAHGRPEVVIRDEAGAKVGDGTARFFGGRWVFDYQPPHDMASQNLVFEVTGRDPSGNVIDTYQSRPFKVVPGVVQGTTLQNPGTSGGEGSGPRALTRGQVARTVIEFPSAVTNVTATVTTGGADVGEPAMDVQGGTVRLAFPTDKRTELVLAQFKVEGKDIHGNDIAGESSLFRINPQAMRVQFLQEPPAVLEKGDRLVIDFFVRYPDGSRLRAGEGIPIVSMFARNSPLGNIEPKPLPRDPTIWRATWDPPDDVLTEVPYRVAVGGLDRWQNEVFPIASTSGFFVRDPLVPDYLPVPSIGPFVFALVSFAVAASARRWRTGD